MFRRIVSLVLGIATMQAVCAQDAATSSGGGQSLLAPAPAKHSLQESAKGHGSISIAYLNTYVNGFQAASNIELPNGAVRSRGFDFDLTYYVADNWSVHFGIPYLDNRYTGDQPHCPTTAPPQCANIPVLNPSHPESRFIDDGRYHGTWQDFNLGVAWYTHINDYFITPSATLTVPSHDYVFFDNAAVGQRLTQLLLSATLAHQFEFTNLYYRLGYGYAFSKHVLGYDTGYQRFDAEFGWFVNEKFSVRTFLTGRRGNGVHALDLLPLTDGETNDYWYRHDQISVHSYHAAGVGFDYDLGSAYTLSTGIQREFWGDTVFNFKYALETRLTRQF
ncbi:MAG: hypothetical protein WBV61_04205 [Rhodanobacteraceae bacterium]